MAVHLQFAIICCRYCANRVPCRFNATQYRLTELRMDGWAFRHWTPFNEIGVEEASSPGYRRAVERQRNRQTLPYGLDIWHGADRVKVLRILWAEDDTIEVVSFVRGPWEEAALVL